MIYFIQKDESGAIKIGFSTNPDKRLRELQCGNDSKLCLIGVIEGSKKQEIRIHHYFRHFKIKGEWFSPSKEILDFISNPFEIPEPQPKSQSTRNPHKKQSHGLVYSPKVIDGTMSLTHIAHQLNISIRQAFDLARQNRWTIYKKEFGNGQIVHTVDCDCVKALLPNANERQGRTLVSLKDVEKNKSERES